MSSSQRTRAVRPLHGMQRSRASRRVFALALAAVLVVSLAAVALASSASPTLELANNSSLRQRIVVSARGLTLYALNPETTHHLLCRSGACLRIWPPLTVRSREMTLVAGAGVHGALGILRRENGSLQVTLRGMPLYRYALDRARGEANGQGIKSFGGTWHAVTAAPSAAKPPSPAPAPSAPGGY